MARQTHVYVTFLSLIVWVYTVTCETINVNSTWPPPPPWQKKANTARYVVHYGEWGIVSAISPAFNYVPFGTLQSYCDGTMQDSTGVPYFYIAKISDTWVNVHYNNSVSLSITHAQAPDCENKGMDPEDPRCARITLVGKMVKIDNTKERNFAKDALFSRHPAMKSWPATHGWDFYKLQLTGICLLDYFGGAAHIPLEEYFKAKPGLL